MRRFSVILFSLVSTCLLAQQPVPAPTAPAPQDTTAFAVKSQYAAIRNNLSKLADRMPAEFYDFQPTPEIKTFAGSLAHIAQANIAMCGTLLGHKHALAGQDLSKTMTTKEQLTAVLETGFVFCDECFNKLTTNAPLVSEYYTGTSIQDGKRVAAKLETGAMAVSFLTHNNEMYGYMAVYLRLKGIVPPTSRK